MRAAIEHRPLALGNLDAGDLERMQDEAAAEVEEDVARPLRRPPPGVKTTTPRGA